MKTDLPEKGAPLTPKEAEVARLIALEGLSNKHIARVLGIKEHTVKNHVYKVLLKLGISYRAQIHLAIGESNGNV